VAAFLEGHEPLQQQVEVRAGETAQIDMRLQVLTGTPTAPEPKVYEPIASKVLTMNLSALAPAEVWQPGYLLIVVEDGKEGIVEEGEAEPSSSDEAGGNAAQPRVDEAGAVTSTIDVRELPIVVPSALGEPVQIVPDLRESGSEAVQDNVPGARVDLPADSIGLLKRSFIAEVEQRNLCDLTRYR
jgi:hypothetical protein